jgi:N-acetylmuramoyl-L-alanine amidase
MNEIIESQPDDASYDEIIRELPFERRGLEDARNGRVTSNEEMRHRIRTCLLLRTAILVLFLLSFSAGAGGECTRSNFIVAIDIGHTKERGGATSATGVAEYSFNRTIAKSLVKELVRDGYAGSFLVNEDGSIGSLEDRAMVANRGKANLLVSIHHDSVQPQYLSEWEYKGRLHLYSDKYRGFSIFYSEKNPYAKESLLFASNLGTEMLKEGLLPTLHHSEKIAGENRQLIDKERGVYRYDELVVLRKAVMPAVLLECGIIVNRQEEALLSSQAYRSRIVSAVRRAIGDYCARQN